YTIEGMQQPHSLSPRALAIAGWTAFAVCGMVFLAIAWNVTTRSALVALDTRVAQWLHTEAHESGAPVSFFFLVTNLHSPLAMALWSAISAAVLWRMRERYWVLTLAVALGGGMLVNFILKTAYERLR